MKQKFHILIFLLCGLSSLLGLHNNFLLAQTPKDTEKKQSQILILQNEYVEYITKDDVSLQRLVKNVKLLHDADTIYCDSAILYRQLNIAEAFGDVLIRQADGTEALADYMRYTGNNKKVVMRGNVQLSDNKGNELWSEEVDYNLNTKVGQYHKNGTLVSGETMVTSKVATYNMKTKDARFKVDVVVNDPEYHIVSKDLGYNTDTRTATFFGPSVVTNENSMLQTTNGYYVTDDKISKFFERTSIFNDGQYIESDTLFYNKNTGWAHAYGNVIMIDTAEHNSTMYCEYAEYNEFTKQLLAYHDPVVKFMTEKETYYYRADTFFSEPIMYQPKLMTAQDSIQKSVDEIKSAIEETIAVEGEIGSDEKDFSVDELLGIDKPDTFSVKVHKPDTTTVLTLPQVNVIKHADDLDGRHRNRKDVESIQASLEHSKVDTTRIDTTSKTGFVMMDSLNNQSSFYGFPSNSDDSSKRYFLGYHQVRIYSDSLQGRCDSMYYNQLDSTITMYVDPLLWSGDNQIKGEVIILLLDSSELKRITVPKDGIMIAKSGPDQAGFFDQIQGNVLKGYLTDGKMDSLVAELNAMNIYFMKDDNDFYTGVNESKSDRIEAIFVNEEIEKIYYRGPTEGVTTPMREIEPSTLVLPRFKWHTAERIQSLEEFLKGKTLKEPQLFRRNR